jgi:hypothetical protein
MEVWEIHRGVKWNTNKERDESLCALLFNVMGYLHELLRADQDAYDHPAYRQKVKDVFNYE